MGRRETEGGEMGRRESDGQLPRELSRRSAPERSGSELSGLPGYCDLSKANSVDRLSRNPYRVGIRVLDALRHLLKYCTWEVLII